MLNKSSRRNGEGESHYVYVLSCANGELYTGYTIDPNRRLRLHNLGIASKFTRARLPVRLVHLEKFQTKSQALKREIQIKAMKRKDKLRLCSIFQVRTKQPKL
jgi:putative endonuclease